MEKKFDAVLVERPGDVGLRREDVRGILDRLDADQFYPVEVANPDGTSCAMGFISAAAAEKIDYDYTELGEFLGKILADMELERDACIYEFKNLAIWMSRQMSV